MAVATRVIRWSEITAQCGNYKAGFVAVFREHEGKETDERDGQGRPMKVSQRSFAEHMGIPLVTFQRWLRAASDPQWVTPDAKEARTAASHAAVAKNLARKDPVNLVSAIEDAGPAAMDNVYHELKLRRAGIPPSTKANRKAAEARASAFTEGIRRLFQDDCSSVPAVIDELTEELETAVASEKVTMQTLEAIITAANRLVTTATAAKAFAQ